MWYQQASKLALRNAIGLVLIVAVLLVAARFLFGCSDSFEVATSAEVEAGAAVEVSVSRDSFLANDTSRVDTAPADTPLDSADVASRLVSTPDRVTCGSTSCPSSASSFCCGDPYAGWKCSTGCPSDKTVRLCDERADCGAGQSCCAIAGGPGSSWCRASCSGTQYCMTDAECGTDRKCIEDDGPPTWTHGVCK